MSRVPLMLAVFAPLACASDASAAPEYSITDLGTLGGSSSYATGINDRGQVAGDSYTASGAEHAFVYSNAQMTDLGTLPSPYDGTSRAGGINDSGEVVGVSENPSTGATQGFLYSNGSMNDLGGSPGVVIFPEVINNAGMIGGTVPLQGFGEDAFIYSNGVRTDLGNFGYLSSAVVAINNRGVAAVQNATGPSTDTVLYKGGKAIDLGNFSADGIFYVQGINDSGQLSLAAEAVGGDQKSYIYSDGTLTDLGSLGPSAPSQPGTSAGGINDSGEIVGQSFIENVGEHAFLYHGGTMEDLNNLVGPSSGWTLTDAVTINDAGQIAGVGYNPNGDIHAFLLTPIPEPTQSAMMFLLLLAFLGGRPRRC